MNGFFFAALSICSRLVFYQRVANSMHLVVEARTQNK